MTVADSESKYGTRWDISPKFPLTTDQKEEIWAREYARAKGGFVSVAVDDVFLKKLLGTINNYSDPEKILMVGCGVEGIIENIIAKELPKTQINCGDFEKVVEQVKNLSTKEDNVHYMALDTTKLNVSEEYDVIINLDTVASENHQDNTQMLVGCYDALKKGGMFVGTFSSAFAWADIAHLENEFNGKTNGRIDVVDLDRSSILKLPAEGSAPEVWRIYYTPLRLRYLLKTVGFKLESMELYFCDSPYFTDSANESYGIEDPDLPLYDHYVVAHK